MQIVNAFMYEKKKDIYLQMNDISATKRSLYFDFNYSK